MTTNKPVEIPVEAGVKYLSNVFTNGHLPYGILNKNATGCGGTTLALESPFDYIVFVPTIELIENKCNQYNKPEGGTRCQFNESEYEVEILAIHGNFDSLKEKINYYILAARKYENPIKIMATYDSAPNLFDYLVDSLINKCYILVDEFHSLMVDYNFRSMAIENLIEATKKHPKVTYMSATPFKPEHGPIQLEKFPSTIVTWHNNIRPYVCLEKSKSPLKSVKAIIIHDFAGHPVMEITDQLGKPISPEQYFFFVNNVTHIKSIITDLPYKIQDQMCIICTNNESNRDTLGDLINLVGSTKSLKRYNFLTKRAYYGCDIYSKQGLSIVVTNVHSEVTLLDVNTDIIQISGRIRNEENPFKNVLVHVYNERPEDKNQEYIRSLAQKYNEKAIKTSDIPNFENFNRHERFKYFLRCETYNFLKEAYNNADLQSSEINLSGSFRQELTHYYTGRFDKNLKEICNLYNNGSCLDDLPAELWLFLEDHPIASEAIETLKYKKLKSLRFREKEIRDTLEKENKKKEIQNQIVVMLREKISVGETYPRTFLSAIFEEIYNLLGIEEKAKATLINDYYITKVTSTSNKQKEPRGAMKILGFRESKLV